MPSKKKARGLDQEETDAEEVQRLLLEFDLNKLGVLGSQNNRIFQQLAKFSKALIRAKLIEAQKNVEARKLADQETLTENIHKSLVEKKRGLLESNTCFKCGKRSKVLTPCICFQKDGVEGKGYSVCEDCTTLKFRTCSACQMFLCFASCTSFSCNDCKELICKECRGKQECRWETCSCGKDYCPKIIDKKSAVLKRCNDCQEKTGCNECGEVNACQGGCAGGLYCLECLDPEASCLMQGVHMCRSCA